MLQDKIITSYTKCPKQLYCVDCNKIYIYNIRLYLDIVGFLLFVKSKNQHLETRKDEACDYETT